MPKFIDHHSMPAMPPEQAKGMVGQLKSAIDSKKADTFGVTSLNVFMAPAEAWCYNDGPNAEAIVKHHEAMGINLPIKDVTQVTPVV